MLFLDAVEPLFADRIRYHCLQPVVRVDLLHGVEHERTVLRLPARLEPQLWIDDLETGPVTLGLEAERETLTVLRGRKQAVAAAGRVDGDPRLDEPRRLREWNEVLTHVVRHTSILPSRWSRDTSGVMRAGGLALRVVLTVVALAVAGCGDGETSFKTPARLIGTVGSTDDPDAYEIRLMTEEGAEVTTTLPPREYMLELDDLSTIHNFHLGGPRAGVDLATDVAGTGEKTAVVRLQEGESYIYFCDAHPTTMSVTFSIHGRIRTQN
jgi:hypothetical protein